MSNAPSAPCGEGGTRLSRHHSLSVQLFRDVVCSLFVAAAVFFLLFVGGCHLLDETVYAGAFSDRMADQQFSALADYVAQEHVTADNLRPLDIWCRQHKAVYLTLYHSDRLLYESPPHYSGETQLSTAWYNPNFEDPDREYPLTLWDGSQIRAFLYYYAGNVYYYWTLVLSGAAAFAVFSLCFVSFVHRKLRYIQCLKRELDILAGGDLSYPITVKGQDELGELASGIDQMRKSIAALQAAEDQMRRANAQLVTAMSHDLRTPLTSLMAYLELMEREKYEDQAQLAHFIRRSLDKVTQIKTLADQLFEYVLTDSSQWDLPCLVRMDGDELLQRLLEEYAVPLESRGFPVSRDITVLDCQIWVDPVLLRRVFDNLYSNLVKYADTAYPVELVCRRTDTAACLTVSNRISPRQEHRESTNMGLTTCKKILHHLGGTFSWCVDEQRFSAEMTLPLAQHCM